MQTWMIIWGILFAVTIIAELATLQLVSIWFSAGALAAFFCALAGVPPLIQAIVVAAVSALLLCITRPLLRKIRVKDVLPTNADGEVGKLAVVTEEIDNLRDTGRVRISGIHWKARSEDGSVIPEGASVRVGRIEGTTAFVSSIG